jgi:hypothetical protein
MSGDKYSQVACIKLYRHRRSEWVLRLDSPGQMCLSVYGKNDQVHMQDEVNYGILLHSHARGIFRSKSRSRESCRGG